MHQNIWTAAVAVVVAVVAVGAAFVVAVVVADVAVAVAAAAVSPDLGLKNSETGRRDLRGFGGRG